MPEISVIIPVYNLENDICQMLMSVKGQSFKDFEAIVIDDGSSDHSYERMCSVLSDDNRFRIFKQENYGVSAARNRGMELAQGKYIIFFDGDDHIPQKSLENMYASIVSDNFDMTVGIMTTYNYGKASVNRQSKALSKKRKIDPDDINFINTWSQCNKMYRLSFLRDNGVKFMDVKVAEDGHFLFQVLSASPRICGCKHIVYDYIRRPFWQGEHTASKKVGIKYLDDRKRVYKDILKFSEQITENQTDTKKIEYKDRLVTRFISGGIIQAFYRRIWRCENVESALSDTLLLYRPMLSQDAWEDIVEKDWDIVPDKRLTKEDKLNEDIMVEPLISVVISSGMDKAGLDLSVESLYNQEFPSFEVIMTKEDFDRMAESFKEMSNIVVTDAENIDRNELLRDVKGRYIYFINEPVILDIHTFKKMADKLRNNDKLDFISVYMRGFYFGDLCKNDRINIRINLIDAIFGYGDRERFEKMTINVLDNSFTNKLFRKDALDGLRFSGDDISDIDKIYKELRFEKSRITSVLTPLTDKDFIMRSCRKVSRTVIRKNYIKNRVLEYFAGKGIKKFLRGILRR